MFFSTPSPSPSPSTGGGSSVLPTGSLSLDTDLILLLVAVVIIAWALGQLSLIIFKSVRHARRQARRKKEQNTDYTDDDS